MVRYTKYLGLNEIFLKYSLIKDENKNLKFQNFQKWQYNNQCNRVKSELRGKFIALNTYINTEEQKQTKHLSRNVRKRTKTFCIFSVLYSFNNINIISNEICLVKNSQNPIRVDWSNSEISVLGEFYGKVRILHICFLLSVEELTRIYFKHSPFSFLIKILLWN